MIRRLIVRPRALTDLNELADHIARDSPRAAHRLRRHTVQLMRDLLEWPESHRRVFPDHPQLHDIRRAHPAGFPNHSVYYLVHDEAVEVVRVLHAARDVPGALTSS